MRTRIQEAMKEREVSDMTGQDREKLPRLQERVSRVSKEGKCRGGGKGKNILDEVREDPDRDEVHR
jgi:hypothetical protein